jgi:hypothetical protein
MLKPGMVVAGLALLLAGYVFGVASHALAPWLAICLAPVALGIGLVVLFACVGYAAMAALYLSDLLTRSQLAFLRRYGIQTQAVILTAEKYDGPGEHPGDPCFRGCYRFIDEQGRSHTFSFRGECYDPYDLAYTKVSIHEYYQPEATRQVYYLSRWPSFHYLCGPLSGTPVQHIYLLDSLTLHFKDTGLDEVRPALDRLAEREGDAWIYPSASNVQMRIEEGDEWLDGYDDDEIDQILQALGNMPASSVVIDLHLAQGSTARENAGRLATALLSQFEGVVEDLDTRCWTLAELQKDAAQERQEFMHWKA